MILRLSDWNKYPKAIVDTKTTNKSFIRVAQIYKAMGVENHAFLLALHNPDLQGVDPFDPNLTTDQRYAIVTEVSENPWYFFREIIRIPTSGTLAGISFIANRANIAYLWCCFNHLTTMIIMPRQTGKSVVADSCNTYMLIAGGTNIKMVLFTKDNGLRVSNIERLKSIFDLLPWYINTRDKSDSNNTENITINSLKNRLDTVVGQNTLAGAMKVGRGLTVAILQVDELAFIPHVKESLETALAATGAARENAKNSGSHYYNTYTTTPGYINTEEGAYAKWIYDGCARWTEKFLDLPNQDELNDTIRKNTRRGNLSVLIEYNHRQLGKTDEWLKERILEANATGDRAEADFLNKWSQGSAASPISKENLIRLRDSLMSKKYVDISTEGYVMNWYVEEDEVLNGLPGRQVVLGMDSSEMIGNDYTALCGRDVSTGEVLCTAIINETNVLTLSNFIANLLIKYPNMTFIPEAKSTGVAIIDTVAQIFISKGYNPFTRIFNYIADERDTNKEYAKLWDNISRGFGLSDIYNKYRREFGYRTSGVGKNSRDNLYGTVFNSSIKYTAHLVRDNELITELESLIIKNGRIDHPNGGHDDLCFIGETLVLTDKGNMPIKDIKPGCMVLTMNGYRKVLVTSCREAEVITKYGLTGTPNHPFITPNGIVEFKDITDETEVYIWKEKLLSIKAKNIIGIQNQKEDNIESTSGNMISLKSRQSRYIDKSTLTRMGVFQKAIKFITKTEIRSTTILKTLKHFQSLNTGISTLCQKRKGKKEEKGKRYLAISINGGKNIQKKHMNLRLRMERNPEMSLANGGKQILSYIKSNLKTVLDTYQPDKSLDTQIKMVYNLLIDSDYNYFANNVLVHNCIGYLLPYYLLTQGKNLESYGIDTSKVLSSVKMAISDENGGPVEEYKRIKQQRIKDALEVYLDRMKKCEDPYIKQQLATKAKSLYDTLDEESIVAFNLQDLLSKVTDEARIKRIGNVKKYAF